MPSVFGVVDARDFLAIDLQMTLAPGRDVYFKLLVADNGDKFLDRGAFPAGEALFVFSIRYR